MFVHTSDYSAVSRFDPLGLPFLLCFQTFSPPHHPVLLLLRLLLTPRLVSQQKRGGGSCYRGSGDSRAIAPSVGRMCLLGRRLGTGESLRCSRTWRPFWKAHNLVGVCSTMQKQQYIVFDVSAIFVWNARNSKREALRGSCPY